MVAIGRHASRRPDGREGLDARRLLWRGARPCAAQGVEWRPRRCAIASSTNAAWWLVVHWRRLSCGMAREELAGNENITISVIMQNVKLLLFRIQ